MTPQGISESSLAGGRVFLNAGGRVFLNAVFSGSSPACESRLKPCLFILDVKLENLISEEVLENLLGESRLAYLLDVSKAMHTHTHMLQAHTHTHTLTHSTFVHTDPRSQEPECVSIGLITVDGRLRGVGLLTHTPS